MSHTLLDGINEVLKRVNVIDTANIGLLTSLTNSGIQHNIDISLQVINEGIDELYSANVESLPNEQAESTITLSNGIREYSLASDLITMIFPMVDRANTQYIWEYGEGYNALLLLDPQQAYVGLPIWGVISPINGKLRLDRACDTSNAGHVYYYEYKKNLALAIETDAMPFNDEVFRAMVPAWVQLYKREMRNEFDQALWAQNIGRASRALIELNPRKHYHPRG